MGGFGFDDSSTISPLWQQEFIVSIQIFLVYARFSSIIFCMDKTPSHEALSKAIALYPTLRAFADVLEVRYQVVQQWLVNGVPAEYCPQIERLTNGAVRCEDLNDKVDWAYLRAASQPDPFPAKQNRAADTPEVIRETTPAGRRVNHKIDRGML